MHDDDVYDHIGERLKLERETENGGVCAKKRVSTKAVVLRQWWSVLCPGTFTLIIIIIKIIGHQS